MPEPAPPEIGRLNLYSSVRPPLTAGKYRLELSQSIDAGGAIAPVTRHIELDAPRFTLPATEIHSVFPPPNERGPFENRLAQIALSRRTLPWERDVDGAPPETRAPWLALVLLADGEANFLSGVAIADAITAGARDALGITDSGTCDTLEVSSTVVEKVFPREDELELLCHVRQVNLGDTEYAGSDDDGFVAIVLSNRLPLPGQRYGAYLISLEGQLAELPGGAEPPAAASAPARTRTLAALAPVYEVGEARVYDADDATISRYSYDRTGGAIDFIATEQPDFGLDSGATSATASPWASAETEPVKIAVASGNQGFVSHGTDFDALHAALELPPPRKLRFPVLAHWGFECSGDGDFQSLMQRIDTGLLGTEPQAAHDDTFQVADTGHTVVSHVSRRGESGSAWYRGPFTPRQVVRRAATRPYHVADQARRIAEDGMEDISEAAAFELGRLLALASGEFARILQQWRRDGIGLRRVSGALDALPGVRAAGLVAETRGVGSVLGVELLAQIANEAALGTPVPATDPAVDALVRDAPLSELAAGLGIPQSYVEEVLSPKVTESPLPRAPFERRVETDFAKIADHKERLESLVRALDASVTRALADASAPAPAQGPLTHLPSGPDGEVHR